jgi:hypothetical protein
MPAAVLSFLLLFMAAYGAGEWSLGAVIRGARAKREAGRLRTEP